MIHIHAAMGDNCAKEFSGPEGTSEGPTELNDNMSWPRVCDIAACVPVEEKLTKDKKTLFNETEGENHISSFIFRPIFSKGPVLLAQIALEPVRPLQKVCITPTTPAVPNSPAF